MASGILEYRLHSAHPTKCKCRNAFLIIGGVLHTILHIKETIKNFLDETETFGKLISYSSSNDVAAFITVKLFGIILALFLIFSAMKGVQRFYKYWLLINTVHVFQLLLSYLILSFLTRNSEKLILPKVFELGVVNLSESVLVIKIMIQLNKS